MNIRDFMAFNAQDCLPYFNKVPHQLPFALMAIQRMMFLILKIRLKLSVIWITSS